MNRERRPAPRRTLPGTFTAAPKPNTRQPSSGKPGMARQAPQGKPKASMPRPALSVGRRDKDRMVELADDDMQDLLRPQSAERGRDGEVIADVDVAGSRGRITVYCVADAIDMKDLHSHAKKVYQYGVFKHYPEVLHHIFAEAPGEYLGDVFYFDYGVVVFWGFTSKHTEQLVMHKVVEAVMSDPLDDEEVEIDEFEYHYSGTERPNMKNDVVTLSLTMAGDPKVKLSIAHALAQSTKLCVYEERVSLLAAETKHLPEELAATGRVLLGRKDINKLIGEVFIHRSAVNLLSTVLDTPEFFWSAPDTLQSLYRRCCDYLELDTRVEVLNTRCGVLSDMFGMVRDQEHFMHNSRLEWIIIWLIVVEVVLGLISVAGVVGGILKDPNVI